jgi:hypothetical protein
MITIGIEEHSGHVFQRTLQTAWYPIWPTPILTQTEFVAPGNTAEMFTHTAANPARYWFREFTYDPVSRIRRGVFYRQMPEEQPQKAETLPHPMNGGMPGEPSAFERYVFPRRLFTYHPLVEPACVRPYSACQVLLGAPESRWKILSVEKISGGELLHTLKAKSSLGTLPELDLDKVPPDARAKAAQVYQELVDAAYLAGPRSVVDRARDAAQWFLAAWYAEINDDPSYYNLELQQLIDKIKKTPNDKLISAATTLALRPELIETVTAAGQIPARLHARKPHEEHARNLRPVLEEDAECAIACIGLLLREFQWAA